MMEIKIRFPLHGFLLPHLCKNRKDGPPAGMQSSGRASRQTHFARNICYRSAHSLFD